MRVTIHLVSPRDYWPFAAAVREARRTLWLRAWKEPDADAMAEAARTLQAALAAGALPRKEVEASPIVRESLAFANNQGVFSRPAKFQRWHLLAEWHIAGPRVDTLPHVYLTQPRRLHQ